VVEAMRADSGDRVAFLRVDGGAARNDLLLQFQSDLLEVEIHRPRIVETTAMGAALLAGLAAGVWKDEEDIRRLWAMDKRFISATDAEAIQAHLDRWRAAVAKA